MQRPAAFSKALQVGVDAPAAADDGDAPFSVSALNHDSVGKQGAGEPYCSRVWFARHCPPVVRQPNLFGDPARQHRVQLLDIQWLANHHVSLFFGLRQFRRCVFATDHSAIGIGESVEQIPQDVEAAFA